MTALPPANLNRAPAARTPATTEALQAAYAAFVAPGSLRDQVLALTGATLPRGAKAVPARSAAARAAREASPASRPTRPLLRPLKCA